MSISSRRAAAAAISGFVADAARMPLHWVYDANELKTLVEGKDPAFLSPPASKFYNHAFGSLSPYGDEIVSLLQYLSKTPGQFSPTDYATASYDAMKVYPGYRNGVMCDLIANVEAGKEYPALASDHPDTQGLNKVPLLVARFAGQSDLVHIVRQAVKVHQNSAVAIEAAVAGALILERIVISGSSIRDAIAATKDDARVNTSIQQLIAGVLQDVATSSDVTAAIEKYGKACPLPGAFQGALVVLLANGHLVSSIQQNIVAGGDNCGRSIFIGAVAAAAGEVVPDTWTKLTTRYVEFHALVAQVVAHNPSLKLQVEEK
ncbi:Aste57867_19717 [Aphanomyces stellatus]|uniref:Aste57867_19717 protein n=1 Tax=Aphanomyces stellatus TaxID=120398 RepID=A0A485LDC6_9STRA|nr:hypothetical protein As57867_019652 [Aphanomyces stellatus]VFT96416.1 Aste57867_19717 [Aphanomyces stellatus]